MRHLLTIRRVVPWTDYGPFEGHIEVRLGNNELCLYITVASRESWRTIPHDLPLEADIWLERTGTVRNGEPSLAVDLDAGQYPEELLPQITMGDQVQVVGRLRAVLEPGATHSLPV
jgi:hypothetical protein